MEGRRDGGSGEKEGRNDLYTWTDFGDEEFDSRESRYEGKEGKEGAGRGTLKEGVRERRRRRRTERRKDKIDGETEE